MSNESTVGVGVRVKGTWGGEGNMRLRGRLEGEIDLEGSLFMEENSSFEGEAFAEQVMINSAHVAGEISARSLCSARGKTHIQANLRSPVVELAAEIQIQGTVQIAV